MSKFSQESLATPSSCVPVTQATDQGSQTEMHISQALGTSISQVNFDSTEAKGLAERSVHRVMSPTDIISHLFGITSLPHMDELFPLKFRTLRLTESVFTLEIIS